MSCDVARCKAELSRLQALLDTANMTIAGQAAEVAQLQDLLATQDRALAAQDEPLTCDYCGADTFDPWHGSTADNKHLHACENCLHLLSRHQRQAGPLTAATPAMWTDAEIAAGHVGIRWVMADGVFGRPTADDVRRYLAELGEIALAAEQEVIYMDAGHLREVLNGNDMPAYCSSQAGRELVPLYTTATHWRPAQDLPPR